MAANPTLSAAYKAYAAAAQPAVALLYAGKPADAVAAVARQREILAESDAPPEVREAALRRMDYLCYQASKAAARNGANAAMFNACLERLSQPAESEAARVMRAIVLIELLAHASRCGLTDLPAQDMYALLACVPEEDRDQELWFHISSWAFEMGDIGLLEAAYEASLLNPTDFRDQYPFQRVKLMHRLLTGTLTEPEIAAVLNQMDLLPEILEFRRHIWPRIQQAGLATEAVGLLLDARQAALEQIPAWPAAALN